MITKEKLKKNTKRMIIALVLDIVILVATLLGLILLNSEKEF